MNYKKKINISLIDELLELLDKPEIQRVKSSQSNYYCVHARAHVCVCVCLTNCILFGVSNDLLSTDL